jgi:hypothetical protein
MGNYIYEATIKDEETDEVISRVFSYSQEGLEEEMGKRKFTEAIKKKVFYHNDLEDSYNLQYI